MSEKKETHLETIPDGIDENDLEHCPNSKDGHGHCAHWWDGEGCCWCSASPMTHALRIEQGCIEIGDVCKCGAVYGEGPCVCEKEAVNEAKKE